MSPRPPRSLTAALGSALVLGLVLGGCEPGSGEGRTAAAPGWDRDVRPLLAERCLACHGPDGRARQAGLRLDTRAGLTGARRGGPAVVPGDPGAGSLLARVASTDPSERMPPPDAGPPLTADEVALLRDWVAAGAPVERHWAYRPLAPVRPPQVVGVEHPVDRFVRARLAAEGLTPAPRADDATLIRRLSLDLIGLAPTADEVLAFLADEGSDKVDRLIDRLLASPHFGERWARHWLDLARYADSHGFTIDGGRSMWPWRDWVVDALNADMPFDRFTVEQLAGDLLPGATVAQRVATGFHRNTQVNQEGGAKDEENRVLAVIDRVDTTGAVWLGSTLSCARCHDHKYDPVSQREYFGLFACFDQTADGGVSAEPRLEVPADAEQAAALVRHEAGVAAAWERVRVAESTALAGWRVWQPERATGSNGPELRPLPDGSFLSVGHRPLDSVYDLSGVQRGPLQGLRLDLLPDPSLPGGGPGRAGNGNLVLQQLRLSWRDPEGGGDWQALPLARVVADAEQDTRPSGGGHFPAASLLPGGPGGGWALLPGSGQPHTLLLALAEPLPDGERQLRVELVQEHGEYHVAGRFRLALWDGRTATSMPASGASARLDPGLVSDVRRRAWDDWLAARRDRPDLPHSLVLQRRAEPRVTRLFRRGDPLDPGEVVAPGVPAVLTELVGEVPVADRLDLARWLVHEDNALVQRVTVNRWWQRLFGTGLVETENDFGLRGARPSHPELLEWLAGELVRGGWSLKQLLRLVCTSATYQQASDPRPDVDERDPRQRLLARQRPLRLDAESLRDSALRASGLLVPTLGGPPVQPPQPEGVFAFTQSKKGWTADEGDGRYRRSLYTRLWRSSLHPFLTTFDAPVPTVTCTRRTRSVSPLQALTLANDPMVLELAAGLGDRGAERMASSDRPPAQARRQALAWMALAATSHPPADAVVDELVEHWLAERDAALATQVEGAAAEATAWTAVGRVLLNLHAVQTRG